MVNGATGPNASVYPADLAAFTADLIEVRRGWPLVLLGGQYDESRWGISRCVFLFHVGHGNLDVVTKLLAEQICFRVTFGSFESFSDSC